MLPFSASPAVDAVLVFGEDRRTWQLPQVSGSLGLQVGRADALDVMDAVAVRADRGEADQSFFEEGPAVDALQVFLVGRFGVDVVLDDDVHVLVAAGADQGDVRPADDGVRVRDRLDVVLPVAVPAAGDVLLPAQGALAVDAVGVGRGRARRARAGGPVAAPRCSRPAAGSGRGGRAFRPGGGGCRRRGRQNRMAVRAGQPGMDRAEEGVRAVAGQAGRRGGRGGLRRRPGLGRRLSGRRRSALPPGRIRIKRPVRACLMRHGSTGARRRAPDDGRNGPAYLAGTGCLILSQDAAKSKRLAVGVLVAGQALGLDGLGVVVGS